MTYKIDFFFLHLDLFNAFDFLIHKCYVFFNNFEQHTILFILIKLPTCSKQDKV